MSTVADKIRVLKETVEAQNAQVQALRRDKEDMSTNFRNLYGMFVKYKPEYVTNASIVENPEFPDLRFEDLNVQPTPVLIQRVSQAVGSVVNSLTATRAEVNSVYKELDAGVDQALETWRNLEISGNSDARMKTFRQDTFAAAAPKRAQTPDMGYAASLFSDSTPSRDQTEVPSAASPIKGANGVGKQKSTSTTLGEVASNARAKLTGATAATTAKPK